MIITVDLHEDQQIVQALEQDFKVNHQVTAGTGLLDYTWADHAGKLITVERKTVHDLSGRVDDLENQLKTAMQAGVAEHVTLLIEGVMCPAGDAVTALFREGRGNVFFNDRATPRPYTYYMSFVLSILENGIPTFFTANRDATAKFLKLAIVKSQNPNFTTFNRYIRKRTVPELNPQVQTLVNIGVGPGRALGLIDKYKTVYKVIQALDNPKDMCQVDGVGPSTVKLIKEKIGWA